MAKYVALTVRKLKDGSYDDWREAWWDESEGDWPEGAGSIHIVRNTRDPNEVIAFGFFEGDLAAMQSNPEFAEMQRKREEAMAPFIESIGADGVYEVIEELHPPA